MSNLKCHQCGSIVAENNQGFINLELKQVFYCFTSDMRWGKGLTMLDATKSAGVSNPFSEKKKKFVVMAAIFNNPSDVELKSLEECIVPNQIDGSPMYYNSHRSQEDDFLIAKYHVGWVVVINNSK